MAATKICPTPSFIIQYVTFICYRYSKLGKMGLLVGKLVLQEGIVLIRVAGIRDPWKQWLVERIALCKARQTCVQFGSDTWSMVTFPT
jgi:hypothetical protein